MVANMPHMQNVIFSTEPALQGGMFGDKIDMNVQESEYRNYQHVNDAGVESIDLTCAVQVQAKTLANKLSERKGNYNSNHEISASRKRPSSASARNASYNKPRFQDNTSRMSDNKQNQSPSQVGRIAAKKFQGTHRPNSA